MNSRPPSTRPTSFPMGRVAGKSAPGWSSTKLLEFVFVQGLAWWTGLRGFQDAHPPWHRTAATEPE
ncbi:hypothetical protein CFAM422_005774 [Trichoderma lentiforme]|uniref:Uncharacterized protein n=1 Tax=Trichoderma lentiforme TaxID=1567552 RepID=A0A9P4XHJ2_9HYPO|nr:hypothetical protein CFAM422_005774 [Trichoderma lentiforme]